MYILKESDTVIAQSESEILFREDEKGFFCDGVIYCDPHGTMTVTETPDRMAAAVRAQRNAKLFESDWTQLDDSPGQNKLAWATYRQALRDITAQEGFPWSVDWPTQP